MDIELRDLMRDAVAQPPGGLPEVDSVVRRGRRRVRLRTGMRGVAAAGVVGAVALGATMVGPGHGGTEPTQVATSVTDTPDPLDPAILQDVIAATYPGPGPEALRMMRVQTFLANIGIEECGGTPDPLDQTSDRYSQDQIPNLDLIREHGFTEPEAPGRTSVDDSCDEIAPDSIGSFDRWMETRSPWWTSVDRLMDDPSLDELKVSMAQCLRDRSGLKVKEADPAGSFLGAVDGALQRDGTEAESDSWAADYADCGEPLFSAFGELLKPERAELVEQDIKLLTRLATEMAQAGYRP